MKIEMVDLKGQYEKIKSKIDHAVLKVISEANFINGSIVNEFAQNLSSFLGGAYVIPCANGTDALQLALMSLDLEPGDEIIIPAFTYVATAEVIGLLKLKPIMVDVDINTYNLKIENIEAAITPRTKVIVPVHLFGQCVDMEPLLNLAKHYGLYVIEDAAQAIGAVYTFKNGIKKQAGTIGHIGCTSFFPSKNLGCFGDGGAVFTNDEGLAKKIRMIANHGQVKKYVHKYIGINSRLDSMQAAVLNIKLQFLNEYSFERETAADRYDLYLKNINEIILPTRTKNSTHVFHQYTIRVLNDRRDSLKNHLESLGIPSMVYYPIPLNRQEAYSKIGEVVGVIDSTNCLCGSVLSLPMHTELTEQHQEYICSSIISFMNI